MRSAINQTRWPKPSTRHLVLALEALDPTCGVHDLLLTSEEWMTLVANFDLDRFLRGAGDELVSASTTDTALDVTGMDFGLHDYSIGGES